MERRMTETGYEGVMAEGLDMDATGDNNRYYQSGRYWLVFEEKKRTETETETKSIVR